MAKKSTKNGTADKRPPKPCKDYPLFFHQSGRIAKKVRKKLHYFGRWGKTVNGEVVLVENLDEAIQAAWDLFEEQKNDLYAGRSPRKKSGDELTVQKLTNDYMNFKRRRFDSGELSKHTFSEYHHACIQVIEAFGKNRVVGDLESTDFAKLRTKLAETHGPVTLSNDIQRIRMIFKFGRDEGLIEKPIPYGQSFDKPNAKTIRKAKRESGAKHFEAEELRMILDALDGQEVVTYRTDEETREPVSVKLSANPELRAMVLLGVNCGYGQSDCAGLPKSVLDLPGGWVGLTREKTEVSRKAKLWPETTEALRQVIADRPAPKDPVDADLVFLTPKGKRWLRQSGSDDPKKGQSRTDLIGRQFSKLLKQLGINGRRGFYGCRHSFRTAADGSRDKTACDVIMGHVDSSMGANYRHGIDDSRLVAVAQHVHSWLWTNSDEG